MAFPVSDNNKWWLNICPPTDWLGIVERNNWNLDYPGKICVGLLKFFSLLRLAHSSYSQNTFRITYQPLEEPWWSDSKRICLQCRRRRFDTWAGKIPWRRKWQLTPVFLLGESHGQRRLVGYSPWGRKESDRTQRLTLSLSPFRLKERHFPTPKDKSNWKKTQHDRNSPLLSRKEWKDKDNFLCRPIFFQYTDFKVLSITVEVKKGTESGQDFSFVC